MKKLFTLVAAIALLSSCTITVNEPETVETETVVSEEVLDSAVTVEQDTTISE
jgi:uncharacterized lipoprotein YajG